MPPPGPADDPRRHIGGGGPLQFGQPPQAQRTKIVNMKHNKTAQSSFKHSPNSKTCTTITQMLYDGECYF